MTLSLSHLMAANASTEEPEGSNPQQADTEARTSHEGVVDMRAQHPSGLSNGEHLQLWMLVRALKFNLESGMHLTRPAMVYHCWLHWMERAGVNLGGKRPTNRTKLKMLLKHFPHLAEEAK